MGTCLHLVKRANRSAIANSLHLELVCVPMHQEISPYPATDSSPGFHPTESFLDHLHLRQREKYFRQNMILVKSIHDCTTQS